MSFLFGWLEKIFTHAMVDWLVKAIKAAFVFIGGATILEIWGIEVGLLIAGLGLFGVAVALAAQNLFKNLIAGILILAEKRFGKAPVQVPNTQLSDRAVTNFSAMAHRRIYWTIGVECRTSVDQLRRIRDEIERYVLDSPDFAKPPAAATFVRIDRFSDSSIDIMLYCFTATTDWGEWLEIKERLAYKIVETAGSAFAFPSQSLYVETLPSEVPEVFVPPAS